MLSSLRIRNIAVIDSVDLSLAPALNVLTGETGAGKSLIVGALGLLLGDRAAGDRLRTGAERGSVEGVFELPSANAARSSVFLALDERGIDTDGALIVLKRELTAAGRSRAWINGTPVTASILSEIGGMLVSVHGQHETQFLMQAETQRDVLDRFADAREVAQRVHVLHEELRQLETRAAARQSARRDAERRADYLRFVVKEISDASPRDGEDERVESEIRVLAHAQEIRHLSSQGAVGLDGDEDAVIGKIGSVRRTLVALARFDSNAERWLTALDAASYSLDEIARELTAFSEEMEDNPKRLQQLEARRDVLHQLMRKYGPGLAEVHSTLISAQSELELVDGAELSDREIASEIDAARETLATAARELTALRTHGAGKLGQAVSELLPELGMLEGSFRVSLEPQADISAAGGEQVVYQVLLNAGSDWRPLSRVASGGELARIMLALSTVIARLQDTPTLVFDEVDAGVGGTVAWQVGALMRRVAGHHQVLAISHLAQIAARAHHHLVVHKSDQSGVTSADTVVVLGDARVVEIARMLGGDSDREVSRAHARELLDRGSLDVPVPAAGALNGKHSTDKAAPRAAPGASQRRGKRV
ncbi:MAG: DNA repair protein RecN [Phycisphaerae bacterium]|nr:DNA repair protein RecN [Gemmatimonadaceae bacterium]